MCPAGPAFSREPILRASSRTTRILQYCKQVIAEYNAGLALVPTHSYIRGMLGHAYAMSGQREKAAELLEDQRLEFEQGGLSDLKAAYICLALGDRERAFQHFERDYDQRDPELPYINVDPVFDPVRDDPRFISILMKMGFAVEAGSQR